MLQLLLHWSKSQKCFFSPAANAWDDASGKLKTIAACYIQTEAADRNSPAQLSSISVHLVSTAVHNNATRCTFHWNKCLVELLIKSTGEMETEPLRLFIILKRKLHGLRETKTPKN